MRIYTTLSCLGRSLQHFKRPISANYSNNSINTNFVRMLSQQSQKMAKSTPIFIGDAFTTGNGTPFTGNPAAVCLLEYDDDLSDDVKLKIAQEVHFTATAFVSKDWSRPKTGSAENVKELGSDAINPVIQRKIRWFSLKREVPLCGHASIVSSKVLGETQANSGLFPKAQKILIEFEQPVYGRLGASYDCQTGRASLNFPLCPSTPFQLDGTGNPLGRIAEALQVPSTALIQDVQYSPKAHMLLVRLNDAVTPTQFAAVSPDFDKLDKLVELADGMTGVILTAKKSTTNEPGDFFTRYFSICLGFHEDPACGSAHTVLTPYWSNELDRKMGETLISKCQSSRGGLVQCKVVDNERVELGGDVNVLIRGNITV